MERERDLAGEDSEEIPEGENLKGKERERSVEGGDSESVVEELQKKVKELEESLKEARTKRRGITVENDKESDDLEKEEEMVKKGELKMTEKLIMTHFQCAM